MNNTYMCFCMNWFGHPEMSPETMYNRRDVGVAYVALFGKQWWCGVGISAKVFLMFSLSSSNNLQDVQKEINDVQVEIQCGKGVVVDGELDFMSTPWSKHHLGVEDNVEGKDPLWHGFLSVVHMMRVGVFKPLQR